MSNRLATHRLPANRAKRASLGLGETKQAVQLVDLLHRRALPWDLRLASLAPGACWKPKVICFFVPSTELCSKICIFDHLCSKSHMQSAKYCKFMQIPGTSAGTHLVQNLISWLKCEAIHTHSIRTNGYKWNLFRTYFGQNESLGPLQLLSQSTQLLVEALNLSCGCGSQNSSDLLGLSLMWNNG